MLERIANLYSPKMKIIFTVALVQLASTVALIVWWGHLLLEQASRLSMLSSDSQNSDAYQRTARMIFLEGGWFLVVISFSVLFLLGLYVRDSRRTKALQAFFASLTHELKTPLTSVRLQAESLMDVNADDTYRRSLLGRLLQDTSRLEMQVERALELARVEGGGGLALRPIRIKVFIDRVAEYWEGSHKNRINITNYVQDRWVHADSNALQIILKNLFENSIKHAKREMVAVTLESRVEPKHFYLSYKDNGSGPSLTKALLGKLFQRGVDSQGAGVGLYLTKALMQKMGGHAEFTGDKGFSATLCFLNSEEPGDAHA